MLSGDTSKDVMRALNSSIPNFAPTNLHPKDHVTLYTLDCALVRSTEDFPATRENLTSAMDSLPLIAPISIGHEAEGLCVQQQCAAVGLAIAIVTKRLADSCPGRRVIL